VNVNRRATRRAHGDPGPDLTNLPISRRPQPAGLPHKGAAYPTAHEANILRRLARPGAYLQITYRGDATLYTYEDGSEIKGAGGGALSDKDAWRLCGFLDPIAGEALWGRPQRYRARRAMPTDQGADRRAALAAIEALEAELRQLVVDDPAFEQAALLDALHRIDTAAERLVEQTPQGVSGPVCMALDRLRTAINAVSGCGDTGARYLLASH
jgi:hypothetical protein